MTKILNGTMIYLPTTNNNDKKTRADIYLDKKTKKFKKGNPGGGKPKGTISVVSLIKKVLKERAKTTDGQEKQRVEVLARNIVAMAISQGDKDMIKLVVSYIDGLPRQPIDLKADINISKILDDIEQTTN